MRIYIIFLKLSVRNGNLKEKQSWLQYVFNSRRNQHQFLLYGGLLYPSIAILHDWTELRFVAETIFCYSASQHCHFLHQSRQYSAVSLPLVAKWYRRAPILMFCGKSMLTRWSYSCFSAFFTLQLDIQSLQQNQHDGC